MGTTPNRTRFVWLARTLPMAGTVSVGARRPYRLRRRAEEGQSAIIAVIVLFLLLFLGAAFIALIANNLRSTQRATTTSESGRFAEAGIHYLDQQLMTSPQGADWRPAPTCPPSVDGACTIDPTKPFNAMTNPLKINTSDPDYYYLQTFNKTTGLGGYTRVNFGGPTPGNTSNGGRSLVRVTYQPDVYDEYGVNQANLNGAPPDPAHKYIKLESVGRSGQVDPFDPTTFGSSNAFGQRVELVAYKQIGLNEYIRQVTNKDNRPDSFALGDVYPVQDYDANFPNTSSTNGASNPNGLVSRDVETLINGPVRVNGNLTFYGVNRLLLNPTRNDALEVAGKITLNGVSDGTTGLNTTDPTRVYVNVAPSVTTGNLFPSDSASFTTTYPDPSNGGALRSGQVRDNPRGSETIGLVDQTTTDPTSLRAVSHAQPPLIDTPIGPNGLTRYLALTRDSVPLPTDDVMPGNPLDASLTTPGTNGVSAAGADGWGQGIYLANNADLQTTGVTSSLRSEWLNPGAITASGGVWTGDLKYVPPAVDIVLTPAYMIMSSTTGKQYFHAPSTTLPLKSGTGMTTSTTVAGQILPQTTIVRYANVPNVKTVMNNAIPDGTPVFQGYPYGTSSVSAPSSASNPNGDIVIYAEGNVSIRGTLSGYYDPTSNARVNPRHLTVVSNGTIYINGNLLRDNLPANDADHNKSTIALLAKQYVTVNTTQFLSPGNFAFTTESGVPGSFPATVDLNADPTKRQLSLQVNLGPENRDNKLPDYVSGTTTGSNTPPPFQLFFRHAAESSDPKATAAAIQLGINGTAYAFTPTGYDPTTYISLYEATTLLLQPNTLQSTDTNSVSTTGFNDDVFGLATTTTTTGSATLSSLSKINSLIATGADSLFQIQYQTDSGSNADYLLTRFGVAPLDVRIEALIYAQEGSLFIIPGTSFNPDPDDTLVNYIGANNNPANQVNQKGRRAGENPNAGTGQNVTHTSAYFPFYGQPMDARITFYGAISENTTAEIGDQAAWLSRWGWVPNYMGSSGLASVARPTANYPAIPAAIKSAHGPYGYLQFPDITPNEGPYFTAGVTADGKTGGSGIVYQFDDRAISPYTYTGGAATALRKDAYQNVLPIVPALPVAPGLLYFGENTNVPQ